MVTFGRNTQPARRLDYHRQQSLPVMEQLRHWGQQQLDSQAVAANSALGQAIAYFLRHFEGLTAFCRLENAPLFKTLAGAAIADVITSVVATAYQAGINVFDYLVVLQRHAERVKVQPQRWLPWNYQATLGAAEKAA